MKCNIGDIVECFSYGAAIILGPCQIPAGVPEEKLELFLSNPEGWPTEEGWTVQLLEGEEKILSVHKHQLKEL